MGGLIMTWLVYLLGQRLGDMTSAGLLLAGIAVNAIAAAALALISYLGNLRMLKHDIYLECLNTYIDLLAMSGQLSQSPFVNYLSND
jgi:ABC-type Fe3+-siderophore transport system permease subunit